MIVQRSPVLYIHIKRTSSIGRRVGENWSLIRKCSMYKRRTLSCFRNRLWGGKVFNTWWRNRSILQYCFKKNPYKCLYLLWSDWNLCRFKEEVPWWGIDSIVCIIRKRSPKEPSSLMFELYIFEAELAEIILSNSHYPMWIFTLQWKHVFNILDHDRDGVLVTKPCLVVPGISNSGIALKGHSYTNQRAVGGSSAVLIFLLRCLKIQHTYFFYIGVWDSLRIVDII